MTCPDCGNRGWKRNAGASSACACLVQRVERLERLLLVPPLRADHETLVRACADQIRDALIARMPAALSVPLSADYSARIVEGVLEPLRALVRATQPRGDESHDVEAT